MAKTDEERLSELELSLTVLWNSVRRWMSQRSKASLAPELSELDVFLLHLLVYRNRQLRGSDLAFALSIDDMHLVQYSLRKLLKLELIGSAKVGKEVFYTPSRKGKLHYEQFLEERKRYLEPAMALLSRGGDSFDSLTTQIRALSGVYEQAARSAASSPGD